MGGRWNPIEFQFFCFLVLIIGLQIQSSFSLNSEGFILLEFRAVVDHDPHLTFANWNPNDDNPCLWFGVYCVNGKVQMLNLSGLSLEGTLTPELGKLSDLRSLILYKNHFSGGIPKDFGALTKLELLDLRSNNLNGTIPEEIGKMLSLKRLLLCGNKFEGSIPMELGRLHLLAELQFDENLESTVATGIGCANRKFGHCIWQSSLKQLNKAEPLTTPIKGVIAHYLTALPLTIFKFEKESLPGHGDNHHGNPSSSSEENAVKKYVQKFGIFSRRRLLEQSTNLQAAPANGATSSDQIIALPTSQSSGAFPAIPKNQPLPPAPLPSESPYLSSLPPNNLSTVQIPSTSGQMWKYFIILPCLAFIFIVAAIMFFVCRTKAVKTIGPWKTGLSGQLQKAFVTGVPKLNRSELETACEDFSNIIDSLEAYTMYKGTLSSGVEIAVASTAISSSSEWSKNLEMAYRKKIDTLSRINHKNFVNLIGFCEEDQPFNRMMVFEYAPNGTLFEHLHVEEMEHLDWNSRMRIIMGTAYCLQYMHHDLNPPLAHSNLSSSAIYLTDDYAAKVAEICFTSKGSVKSKASSNDEAEHSELPPLAEPETNVYSFGIVLLEIISGKLPYSEEHGSIEKWAAEYLNDKESFNRMIDPTLKSFKSEELEVVCEVIKDCIKPDPRHRPTMKEVISKLREVINISPDQATPRLSPLWWAELEILSTEAT